MMAGILSAISFCNASVRDNSSRIVFGSVNDWNQGQGDATIDAAATTTGPLRQRLHVPQRKRQQMTGASPRGVNTSNSCYVWHCEGGLAHGNSAGVAAEATSCHALYVAGADHRNFYCQIYVLPRTTPAHGQVSKFTHMRICNALHDTTAPANAAVAHIDTFG